jgi:hypothetical protein
MSHVACLIVHIAMFQENVVATTSKVGGFLSEVGRGVDVSGIHRFYQILIVVDFTRSCKEEKYIF